MTAWLDQFCSPIGAFLGAIALLLASYAVGMPLAGRLSERREGFDEIAIDISLGLGVWSVIALILGTTGLFHRSIIRCFIWPAAIAGGVMIFLPFRSWRLPSRLSVLPFCCIGMLLLGSSMVLPLNWDEMVYQVSVPMRWLADGALHTYPDNPYSGFPSGCALIYALAIAAGGASAGKVLSLAMWLLAVLSLWDFPDKENPLRGSLLWWTLCFAFAVCEPVLMAASATYAESFLVLQVSAVFTLLARDQQDRASWKRDLMIGILCGFSLAVKLTGGAVLLGTVAGILASSSKQDKAWVLRRVLLVVGIAAAVALPFYLRPWIQTGNPCHPYFTDLFTPSAGIATQEMSRYHHALGTEKFGLSGAVGLVTTPFLLGIPPLGHIYDGNFGLQFILIALGILFVWRSRGWQMPVSARFCLVFAAVTYAGWYLSSRQARFLLPSAYALVCGLACLVSKPVAGRAKKMSYILVLCTVLSMPFGILRHSALCWKHTLAGNKAVNLLYTATGEDYLPVLDAVQSSTPSDANIMLLFEHRALYVPRNTVIGTPFFQDGLFTPPEAYDADAIQKALIDRHITHVIVGLNTNDPDRIPRYLDRCRGFLSQVGVLVERGFLREEFRHGDMILYTRQGDF